MHTDSKILNLGQNSRTNNESAEMNNYIYSPYLTLREKNICRKEVDFQFACYISRLL